MLDTWRRLFWGGEGFEQIIVEYLRQKAKFLVLRDLSCVGGEAEHLSLIPAKVLS